MISEAQLEKRLVKGALGLDCLTRKIQFINHRGCPDRLIITPNGHVFWVEMKKQGGKFSKAQERELTLLQSKKQNIAVLSSVSEVDSFLETLKCR